MWHSALLLGATTGTTGSGYQMWKKKGPETTLELENDTSGSFKKEAFFLTEGGHKVREQARNWGTWNNTQTAFKCLHIFFPWLIKTLT